jgi:hypothetical protein
MAQNGKVPEGDLPLSDSETMTQSGGKKEKLTDLIPLDTQAYYGVGPCDKTAKTYESSPILLLGMSKANVVNSSPSVEEVIGLVSQGTLNHMDGRDLARCRATELECNKMAYTVSLQEGTDYNQNFHMNGNFNKSEFGTKLTENFPQKKFQQISLDYYNIPWGTWMENHWPKSFFETTLPGFVKNDLLEYPQDYQGDLCTFTDSQGLGFGVYLPFCLHCIEHLLALKEIGKYYTISFLPKERLKENALWRGTSTIEEDDMRNVFKKEKCQEDIHCTVKRSDVSPCVSGTLVRPEEVTDLLDGMKTNLKDIRMILLTPLSKHDSS